MLCYLSIQRERELIQKLVQELESRNRLRTPKDILQEFKNNPAHKSLTRSERRFREHQLEKRLKHTWSQERSRWSRCDTSITGTGPVRGNPTVKETSRMNRQPSPQESHIISLSHRLHLIFVKLYIYIALSFLTLFIFCHNLRINLLESYLLEIEEEKIRAWKFGT